MKRRNFFAALAAAAIAPMTTRIKPYQPVSPMRHWKLFDVAWIEHGGMCVCVRAGTDETAVWQKSEKWERVFKEESYIPPKFVIPLRTSEGFDELSYVLERDERDLA